MKITKYLYFLVCLLLLSVKAGAAPVTFTFTGNWTNGSTGDFGASYIATLILDNGGLSAANQVFGQADFVSARLESGTYDFTMTPGDITSWDTDFSTNGSGQAFDGWFDAASGTNDWHFDTDVQDESFSNANGNAGYFEDHVSNPGTVGAATSTSVPTMSIYALALTIFGLLLVATRRLRPSFERD